LVGLKRISVEGELNGPMGESEEGKAKDWQV